MTLPLSETQDLLRDLISYPTVSQDSNIEMIAYLADRLGKAGARVDLFHNDELTKANLFATLGPDVDGGIVLSGHTDVVPVAEQSWSSDPFEMRQADGVLYGRGSCDMKGFIAACVAMTPRYAEMVTDRPLHFAFTYDEEIGCIGARSLVESLKTRGIRPSVAIIGEPTSMRIIEGHKGCHEYSTHFHGLAGHGSSPDQGVNAVEYAARYVGRLLELKDQLRLRAPEDSRFEPPWTTINTGGLHGGVAHNVIASAAKLDWEMRPVQMEDATFVKEELRGYVENVLLPAMRAVDPGADIVTETIGEVQGFTPTTSNEAKEIMMELTGANDAGTVPFGTEAGIFQDYGMSVVVCGPGSIEQAHKADEFVPIEQLNQCLGMLDGLGEKLSA